jgi:hypothetical protein
VCFPPSCAGLAPWKKLSIAIVAPHVYM